MKFFCSFDSFHEQFEFCSFDSFFKFFELCSSDLFFKLFESCSFDSSFEFFESCYLNYFYLRVVSNTSNKIVTCLIDRTMNAFRIISTKFEIFETNNRRKKHKYHECRIKTY